MKFAMVHPVNKETLHLLFQNQIRILKSWFLWRRKTGKPREKLLEQGKNRTTDSAHLWRHDFNPGQEDSVFTTVPSLLLNWHCLTTSCVWHLNLAVALSYLKFVFLTVFNWTDHFREAVLFEFVTTSVGLSDFYFKLISWALYKVE